MNTPAVYIANPGTLELDFIRTMGVSVKEGESPIGYFGTGLKYGIATCLRNGIGVQLCLGRDTYVFSTRPETMRGQEFNVVYMNDERLAFTDDLGKNWELWMAYREFVSNAMDEGGGAQTYLTPNDTVFTLTGKAILDVHHDRANVFLQSKPLEVQDNYEIHPNPGKSKSLFYRGVRVYDFTEPSAFTYNLTVQTELTEDRTLAHIWSTMALLVRNSLKSDLAEVIEQTVFPASGTAEAKFDWDWCSGDFSRTAQDILLPQRNNRLIDRRIRAKLNQTFPIPEKTVALTGSESFTVITALAQLKDIFNETLDLDEIIFIEDLGPGIYASVEAGKIRVARQTIANGAPFLMIILYEEMLHRDRHLQDHSRGMQQFLFDKLLQFGQEIAYLKSNQKDS